MWGIVGALQSVLKAKPNITVVMLYFRTAERLVISPVLEVWAGTRQSTETVSERVPTRWTKNEPRKKSAISFKDFKRAYSIQIQAFLGVFCVKYIIILPMPLQRRTEPQRATTTHSESSVIIPLYSYFKNQQKTAKMIDRYSGIWYNGSLNNTFFLLLVSIKRFEGDGGT